MALAPAAAVITAPTGTRRRRAAGKPVQVAAPPGDTPTDDGGAAVYVAAWQRTVPPVPPAPAPPARLRGVRDAARTLLLALLFFAATGAVIQGRAVEGRSMEPSLHPGQRLLINRGVYLRVAPARVLGWLPFVHADERARYLFHRPRRGEVIVFAPPAGGNGDLIKRVIAVPGDHIRIADGWVYINGRRLDEPYVNGAGTVCAGPWCDLTLGADEYYVMGDNRVNSSDSRLWGPIRAGTIVGKAWLIYRPLADFGPAR